MTRLERRLSTQCGDSDSRKEKAEPRADTGAGVLPGQQQGQQHAGNLVIIEAATVKNLIRELEIWEVGVQRVRKVDTRLTDR